MRAATITPTNIPSISGSCDQIPFRYTEKRMVASSVARAMSQAILLVDPSAALNMEASIIALPARLRPMIIAIGPVMAGGRMRSITSRPTFFTNKPAATETKPDITMPKVAIEIFSSSERPVICSDANKPKMAAMYEKLDP